MTEVDEVEDPTVLNMVDIINILETEAAVIKTIIAKPLTFSILISSDSHRPTELPHNTGTR